MRISEFDYHLPPDRIAQKPLEQRDASRMLVMARFSGALQDCVFRDLPEILRGDELLVVNSARVIPARLFGKRKGVGAEEPGEKSRMRGEFLRSPIEVLLVRQIELDVWEALVRPGRKVRVGETLIFGEGELEAEVLSRGEYGVRTLRFRQRADFFTVLERLGHIPLPPYIDRKDDADDRKRYQTIFAKQPGAVAAPTAGLHFTNEILTRIRARGIPIHEVTLQVGLGTFQPVRSVEIEQHKMHTEAYEILVDAAEALNKARLEGRRILAIGTTVVRALEDSAAKCAAGRRQSGPARVAPGKAVADIFIAPGFTFRVVDQLLTNFHLPKSTLLAMVCALGGVKPVLNAYAHAISDGYRFYSYGDCMLLR